MPYEVDPNNAALVIVRDSNDLESAYLYTSNLAGGGTILLDAAAGNYSLWLRDEPGPQNPVKITSLDPDSPATLTKISLRDVNNIHIDNVIIDSTSDTDRSPDDEDIAIRSCDDISITNSVMLNSAEGLITSGADRAQTLGHVTWSKNFEFSGNTVSNYYHGLSVTDTVGVTITDNEITEMQGDGMRLGGVQNVLIQGNHFHDFYGTSQNVTHSDMLQFWGAGVYKLTENVTIDSNIFNTGDGAASQTIFMRNEGFGGPGSKGAHFQNVTVTNNLIYNAHTHGISISDVDGVLIDRNTVLWNKEASILTTSWEEITWMPQINVRNTLNAQITNNITGGVSGYGATAVVDNNSIVEYRDSTSKNFVNNHFNYAVEGGSVELQDLRLIPGSLFNGTGAEWTQADTVSDTGNVEAVMHRETAPDDRYKVIFDATNSLDGNGLATEVDYDFRWVFDDGTVLDGITATRVFAGKTTQDVTLNILRGSQIMDQLTNKLSVDTKNIFSIKSEAGLVDVSDHERPIYTDGNVTVETGKGFLVGDENEIYIPKFEGLLKGVESFGLALDILPTGDEPVGTFVSMNGIFRGAIRYDGSAWFQLTTDEGKYALVTNGGIFDDGNAHRIGISYDNQADLLQIFVDGKVGASIEASGGLANPSQNLIFGNFLARESIDAYIDNVAMSLDPGIADDLEVPEGAAVNVVETAEVVETVNVAETAKIVETVNVAETADVVETVPSENTASSEDDKTEETTHLEVGTVAVAQDNSEQWHRVEFSESISDAVVVMGPVSGHGSQPLTVSVRAVTSTSFEFQLDEWNYLDGVHILTEISWMAGSAGDYTLEDGSRISLGSVDVTDVTGGSVAMGNFWDAPMVFGQLSGDAEENAMIHRVTGVTDAGFDFHIDVEESHRDIVTDIDDEIMFWAGVDLADNSTLANGAMAWVDHNLTNVGATVNQDHAIFGDINSYTGPDTAGLRHSVSATGQLSFWVEEEQSSDAEIRHNPEDVAWLALNEGIYDLIQA